jgi:ABC-2 type transport system ATP-binding protein
MALQNLELRVEPGEILGFPGPNGAGKSTTVKILIGMLRPTSGRARVAGFDVVEQPREGKRRIGYVPETGALYENLTAAEYLALVADLQHLEDHLGIAAALASLVLRRWVYPSGLATVTTMALAGGAAVAIEPLIALRVRRLSARWEDTE